MGNAILPVFQVFARHIQTALLGGGGVFDDTQSDTGQSWDDFRPRALASSPGFVMQVAFIYYSYADKLQTQCQRF